MTVATDPMPVIGLEIHAQVLTKSKMFCGCSTSYAGAPPNTHVCSVCAGMPGSLPVINAAALEATILTALALNCRVLEDSKFDRKNYEYPDLPKGYQITQYDMPLARDGWLLYSVDGETERCGITRVHLEEDTGKSLHTRVEERDISMVDLNRAGVPLMEIVSAPDLRSGRSARAFFESLRHILIYLGVNDGNLQEGSLRADVNVSLQHPGGAPGTKVEIKNLNSFRAVERALDYEIERQRRVLEAGVSLVQETRGWSEDDEVTVAQRSKEYAHDYRYFPEPDLPPLVLGVELVDKVAQRLPELPAARFERFVSQYGLPPTSAGVLVSDPATADYFEAAVREAPDSPLSVANWITGELLRVLKERGLSARSTPIPAERLGRLVRLVADGAVGGPAARNVFESMLESNEEPADVVGRLGLEQITETGELARLVNGAITTNPGAVADFRAGKVRALQALIGAVMRESRGKANAETVRRLLEERLR